jgi:hypothetical protein
VFPLDPRCLFSSPGKNRSYQHGSSTNHVKNKVKPCLFPSSQKKISAALRVSIWCRALVATGRSCNLFKTSPVDIINEQLEHCIIDENRRSCAIYGLIYRHVCQKPARERRFSSEASLGGSGPALPSTLLARVQCRWKDFQDPGDPMRKQTEARAKRARGIWGQPPRKARSSTNLTYLGTPCEGIRRPEQSEPRGVKIAIVVVGYPATPLTSSRLRGPSRI